MTEQEFETWWKANRQQLLHQNSEYVERENSYKIRSGADLLIFALPVVAAILFLESGIIRHEMLNWLASAGVAIVTFLVSAFIKSQTLPGDSLYDIEQRIKAEYRKQFAEKGE
ncbi:MAG: hypothetical protein J5506_07570 [Prevotella sp.]|nr:hypothetical protein [Prevotella sp.]